MTGNGWFMQNLNNFSIVAAFVLRLARSWWVKKQLWHSNSDFRSWFLLLNFVRNWLETLNRILIPFQNLFSCLKLYFFAVIRYFSWWPTLWAIKNLKFITFGKLGHYSDVRFRHCFKTNLIKNHRHKSSAHGKTKP